MKILASHAEVLAVALNRASSDQRKYYVYAGRHPSSRQWEYFITNRASWYLYRTRTDRG